MYLADNDIGEMFLNFTMHQSLRPFCGIDVKIMRTAEAWKKPRGNQNWEHWCRLVMGLRNSSFRAVQELAWAKEFVYGDKDNPCNPFRWDKVS